MIELISTEDLIKELMNRNEHLIISGIKYLNEKEQQSLYWSRWKGNNATCQGLCSRLQYIINDAHFKESDEVKLDEL